MSFWEVSAGAVMPIHHHMNEQISQLLEGKFILTVGDERKLLEPGLVAIIPYNVPHGGIGLTDCKLLNIFSPVREGYK